MGNNFGEQLWTTLRIILKNSNFWEHIYKEFWGAIFNSNFGELFSGALLGTILGTSFGAVGSSFEAASGTNFGKKISRITLGSSFANSSLEQLYGAAMRSSFP